MVFNKTFGNRHDELHQVTEMLQADGRFMNPAIVLGGGGSTGLGAIRSLGRAGVPVHYLDYKKSEAMHSRYCRNFYISPKSRDRAQLRRSLLSLQEQISETAVLFPATDSYALHLADLMDELSGYYFPMPRKEILAILINKKKFYHSLLKENVPCPTTHFPENLRNIRKIGRQVSYPVFIKPSVSHLFLRRFRKKGFVANSESELSKYLAFAKKAAVDVMVQEIVPGPPTNHVFLDGYIDKRSNPKALFARRRLRMWPLDFGNSSSCISIPKSEIAHLKRQLFKYLKSIGYHGIFSAEFKKDQQDGVFRLLEINSRTSAWFNTLSARCGINLMLIAYLDAIRRETKYTEDYEAGVKWTSLEIDLRASTKMLISGNLTVREWVSSYIGKSDFLLYARDDIKPFLMGLTRIIFEMI